MYLRFYTIKKTLNIFFGDSFQRTVGNVEVLLS